MGEIGVLIIVIGNNFQRCARLKAKLDRTEAQSRMSGRDRGWMGRELEKMPLNAR